MPDHTTNIECIRRYHQRTKHRFERYADGPETLDWSMQPDPFRHYQGTEKLPLPLAAKDLDVQYGTLYVADKIEPKAFDLNSIAALLELSMGLSAWKEYHGDRWSLRCNPSSGNLHPTEAYVIATDFAGLASGVYHYVSYDHALEQRCVFSTESGTESSTENSAKKSSEKNQAAAAHNDPQILIGLSSIYWREAWKYGERAFRYCQLDAGHALAAIRYACAALGWTATLVTDLDDHSIEQLLGIDRDHDYGAAEREHADLLLRILPNSTTPTKSSVLDAAGMEQLLQCVQQGTWRGTANTLDRRHLYEWPIIDEVALAARTMASPVTAQWTPPELPAPLPCKTHLPAKEIIQRRRSAQSFDGITAIESADFFRILDMLMPRLNTPPWDALPWKPRIHVVFFVHRINGLEPGLYILLRNEQALDSLKNIFSDKMQWLRVDQAPGHLNLYRLVKANAQKAAASLSCHQRIASDSAFSLGMLSEFDAALDTGSWAYKQLYWEAGVLGQVLYLEAEALDLQGTGIGCFFDDPFHEMLGINDTRFQSVYHFTVGGALNDGRLRTLMPYQHLNRE